MNTKSLLALLLLIGLIACNKEEDDGCDPEKSYHYWYSDQDIEAELDTIYPENWYIITPGDKRLFEYHYQSAQCDDIYDDEWGEILRFVVDPSVTHFEYVDEEILEAKCYYNQYGAWVGASAFPVTSGSIEGERMWNGDWMLTVDIVVPELLPLGPPRSISFTSIHSER